MSNMLSTLFNSDEVEEMPPNPEILQKNTGRYDNLIGYIDTLGVFR